MDRKVLCGLPWSSQAALKKNLRQPGKCRILPTVSSQNFSLCVCVVSLFVVGTETVCYEQNDIYPMVYYSLY